MLHMLNKTIISHQTSIRRRTEKNAKKNRAPIQNEVTKKPVSDFGSKSLNEYLLGSRKMKPFPVAMSLVARLVLYHIVNKNPDFNWHCIQKSIITLIVLQNISHCSFQLHFRCYDTRDTGRDL